MEEKIEYILKSGATEQQRLDALLELDRDNVDLGKEFTKEARKRSKKNSKKIYKAIASIDSKTGELFLNHIDK